MGNLLFSPNGQISSSDFMKAGFILIAVTLLLGIIAKFMPQMAKPISWLSYLLIYPWAVVWIKRLRNGGKSGWMFLVYLLLYIVLATIAFFIVGGGEFIKLIMEAASQNIDQAEMEIKAEAMGRSMQTPMMIVGVVISLITLFIGDKTIPKDASGVGSTFD